MNRRALSCTTFCTTFCTILLLALAAGGCSSYGYKDLDITSEYDRSLDFFRFKTWAWATQSTPEISDSRVHELTAHTRFKRNFAAEVLPCGLSPAGDGRPDLLVRYRIWLIESAVGPEEPAGANEARAHDRAGVCIEMLDPKTEKVVWTATALATIDFRAPLDERDRRVRRALREMMQRYPLYEGR